MGITFLLCPPNLLKQLKRKMTAKKNTAKYLLQAKMPHNKALADKFADRPKAVADNAKEFRVVILILIVMLAVLNGIPIRSLKEYL